MYGNKIFKEALDGMTVRDLQQELDYKRKKIKDRMELINNILEKTNFFIEYFTDYYNSNIGTTCPLSLDDNVCKLLESYATYILNSEEVVRENRANDIEYKFISSEKYFENKVKREDHMKSEFNNCNIEVIPFIKKDKNYLKVKEQKILNTDYRDGELGKVLTDYKNFIEMAKNERDSLETLGSRNYYLCRFISEARLDMKIVKDNYKGTIYFKNITNNIGANAIEDIDFTNPKILEILMTMDFKEISDINDLSIILWDFENLIKKSNLKEKDLEILDYYRKGYNKNDIAKVFGVSRTAIHKKIQTIKKKLIKKCLK